LKRRAGSPDQSVAEMIRKCPNLMAAIKKEATALDLLKRCFAKISLSKFARLFDALWQMPLPNAG
jgi:hypothetical protein